MGKNQFMSFNDELDAYIIEINNIIFESEEEKEEDYIDNLKSIAENYYRELDNIIEFMLPDLNLCYGEFDKETIKTKLGKPVIDYDNGTVKYLEHTFDYTHIFIFEFLDDEFKILQYFSIDG